MNIQLIILTVILALLIVGGLGALFGSLLVVAANVFVVTKDKKQSDMEAFLPSLNCGACGYAGCSSYATAILNDNAPLNKCLPGGPAALKNISEYMGVEAVLDFNKKVAFVMCKGSRDKAKFKYEYSGLQDCNAMSALFGGDKECAFGCLGRGSCIKVCPTNAIYKTADGLVKVDSLKCISCEKCVVICPTHVMQMIPEKADYVVACRSLDKGPVTKNNCSVGCIGCKICEKKSPEGGFVVENFLATIDYSKNGSRAEGAAACPVKCIIQSGHKIMSVPLVESAQIKATTEIQIPLSTANVGQTQSVTELNTSTVVAEKTAEQEKPARTEQSGISGDGI